jgi:hypothetical protein
MIRWSPARPVRPRCPHDRLRRLLGLYLPTDWRISQSEAKPWASASFVGARHIFHVTMPEEAAVIGALASKLQQRISDLEWPITGHIVADCAASLASEHGGIMLEILTVED